MDFKLVDIAVKHLLDLNEAEMAQAYLEAMGEKYPDSTVKLGITHPKPKKGK